LILNSTRLPYSVPASSPYNVGNCVSCGGCSPCTVNNWYFYKIFDLKSNSCKSSTKKTTLNTRDSKS
jgi:hypothetical protein